MTGNLTTEDLNKLLNTQLPMWVYCVETHNILKVNDAFERHFEYTQSEIKNQSAVDLVTFDDRKAYKVWLQDVDLIEPITKVWKFKSKLGLEFPGILTMVDFTLVYSPVKLVTCFKVDEKFYRQSGKQNAIPLTDLLKLISHFDFENPRNSKNRSLLNHLKSATQQLESIIQVETIEP